MRHEDEQFAAAARCIADELCAQARSDDDSAHWLTASFEPGARRAEWHALPDLYGGAAGIALFLLEAGHVLSSSRYTEMALAGLQWSDRHVPAWLPYGFYSGRLGIAFAFLRAHLVTGDSRWLERALALAAGHQSSIEPTDINELLYGRAGTALGLLRLYQASGERWTLDAAERWLRRVIETARWTAEGVCWDSGWRNIKPLCGFSHGTAGIATVLLEAARVFDCPPYARLAREAIRYENAAFDAGERTWSDFRKLAPMAPARFAERYGSSSDEELLAPEVMDAWCHGAAGIGFCRLRALELDPSAGDDERDLRLALSRTERTLGDVALRGYTLCHGAGGNALLFVEAAAALHEPQLLEVARGVGRRAVAEKEQRGRFRSGYAMLADEEDRSLMMGTAGVGWFFLRLLAPLDNVLLPRVGAPPAPATQPITDGELARILARSLVPRTAAEAERERPAECDAFFAGWHDRDEAVAFLVRVAGVPGEASVESEMLRFRDRCRSFALAYMEQWRARRDAERLRDPAALRGVALGLSEFARIAPSVDDVAPQLLRIVDGDVVAEPLTPFAAAVLSCFDSPRTVEEAVQWLGERLGDADAPRLRALVEQQVLVACQAGIIAHSRWARCEPTAGS